jgi:NAD-dependent dihydropyrimidine dehydrogenase PreA subunit
MNEIIIVKPEKCVGCNACVRSCPAPEANITKQLQDGRFITAVNPDKCISCGQYVKLCPRQNIRMDNGRPKFGTNCAQCLGCLQYCPKNAISIGRITDRREHYHNSEVKAEDLMEDIIHVDG